jgi:hypothetical protein
LTLAADDPDDPIAASAAVSGDVARTTELGVAAGALLGSIEPAHDRHSWLSGSARVNHPDREAARTLVDASAGSRHRRLERRPPGSAAGRAALSC